MDLEFNKNEDVMKLALSQMRKRFEQIRLGGGKKAIEKQREKTNGRPASASTICWTKASPLSR